ncbi:MAG: hypothetical protein OJI67_10470, partial [Prosthecobacter sp.]|nr:hypothetical protein [Prosthecobacter sp.]
AESLDDLRFLLTIPAIATRADLNGNELLRLALSTANRGAAEILLTQARVREHAVAHHYYVNDINSALDLQQIANDRESSMRTLTVAEQRRLSRVIAHYQPELERLGTTNIMELLREHLREHYENNPAVITVEGQAYTLPLNWSDFAGMPLSPEARQLANQAYYQHPTHTALRWLMRPNPWMAANAPYVQGQPAQGEGYSTFENYSGLISMLWLATSDEEAPGIDGHTCASRIEHFIRELALIGRAHNWDQTREVLLSDGTLSREEYDDLQGDRPSCYSGVNRRLFQAVIGHTLMRPFGYDLLDLELKEFARAHFLRRINRQNLILLHEVRAALAAWEPLTPAQEGA